MRLCVKTNKSGRFLIFYCKNAERTNVLDFTPILASRADRIETTGEIMDMMWRFGKKDIDHVITMNKRLWEDKKFAPLHNATLSTYTAYDAKGQPKHTTQSLSDL